MHLGRTSSAARRLCSRDLTFSLSLWGEITGRPLLGARARLRLDFIPYLEVHADHPSGLVMFTSWSRHGCIRRRHVANGRREDRRRYGVGMGVRLGHINSESGTAPSPPRTFKRRLCSHHSPGEHHRPSAASRVFHGAGASMISFHSSGGISNSQNCTVQHGRDFTDREN